MGGPPKASLEMKIQLLGMFVQFRQGLKRKPPEANVYLKAIEIERGKISTLGSLQGKLKQELFE